MFENFLKCFCVPDILSFSIAVITFSLAYVIYMGLIILFRKIFSNESLAGKIVESLKWPVLFLLVEITFLSFINLFISGELSRVIHHATLIFIMATVGWILGATVRTSFNHFMERLEKDTFKNHAARSMLTQFLFLSRLSILMIFILTLSAILMTFPFIRTIGIGILGSAGILGIALGIAARPIFLNIMAGFQIAFTKTVKIGDAVFLEGEFCRIESTHLTHVVARTWDLRRYILPISYFIDHTFQNWDITDPEVVGTVTLYCDYGMPIDPIRKKVEALLQETPLWNGKMWKVEVIDMNEQAMQVRVAMSAKDASLCGDLRVYMREKLLEFMQNEYPNMLPSIRYSYPTDPTQENLK